MINFGVTVVPEEFLLNSSPSQGFDEPLESQREEQAGEDNEELC
jgi:hypothetical protein